MKLGVLFSGGKDSVFAMHKSMQKHDIACLISIVSSNKESFMFHTPNVELTQMQADALGMKLVRYETKGEKEAELEDLRSAISKAKRDFKIEGIVTGAIESIYQATRIQKICDELDLWCFNPLWQADQLAHLDELVKSGFKVIISAVMAEPFTKKWLGKEIDSKSIKELEKLHKSHKINPAGEGGEFESFVLDGPMFNQKIEVEEFEIEFKNNSGVYDIKKAKLVDKK